MRQIAIVAAPVLGNHSLLQGDRIMIVAVFVLDNLAWDCNGLCIGINSRFQYGV
jgi:hypothetical protein